MNLKQARRLVLLLPGLILTTVPANSFAATSLAPAAPSATVPYPSAPTDLKAFPAADGRSVKVTWSAPEDNGGSPITSYDVLVENQDDWDPNVEPRTVGNVTAYTWTDLEPGERYLVQVAARNQTIHGDNAYLDVTMPDPSKVPTHFQAQPSWDGEEADLSWTAPTTTSPVVTYHVTRTEPGQPWPFKTVLAGTSIGHTWYGLTPGEKYTFTVRARYANGFGAPATYTLLMPDPTTRGRADGEPQLIKQ